ncbi:hypothetical protein Taro_023718 [Colocasia esculenta]|uniref:Uncharacterized protein n=1 Tax=Colocasia esculenta TaxID=4460 RepID=A0A843VBM8_COLES|nr:hypothetical protein [Colocasia esculenta]
MKKIWRVKDQNLQKVVIDDEPAAISVELHENSAANLHNKESAINNGGDTCLLPGGPKPFRFFNMWTQHTDFISVVQAAWSLDVQGTPLFVLYQKLRTVKKALKIWNRDVFGKIHQWVDCAATILHDAQHKLATDPMNCGYAESEKQARENYLHSLCMETSYAQQGHGSTSAQEEALEFIEPSCSEEKKFAVFDGEDVKDLQES